MAVNRSDISDSPNSLSKPRPEGQPESAQMPSDLVPPRVVPSTPLPPVPCLKASVPAAMSETPAFSARPVTPPLAEHTDTPPPPARALIEATEGKSGAVLQAEMAELKAEIAALKKSIDSASYPPSSALRAGPSKDERNMSGLRLDLGVTGQLRL